MAPDFINALRDRWANFHPFLRFSAVVLVLGLVAFFGTRPAYRAFKSWRVDRNLAAAKVAVTETRMGDARDLSLTVLQSGDPRIETFRILEKSMASLQDPRHQMIARALLSHPDGSDEDRLNGLRGLVKGGAMGIVAQGWAALPDRCKKDPRFILVFADRLLDGNRLTDAASILVSAPKDPPAPEIRKRLITVLIRSGSAEAMEEAQRRISGEWPADSADYNEWIELLEKIPVGSLRGDLLEPVRSALEKFPDSPGAALFLTRLQMNSDFSGRAAILDAAIMRWKPLAPEDLAGFMADLGLYQLLLETFPSDFVRSSPVLLTQRLTALRKTGGWNEIIPLVEAHGQLLARHEALGHRAIAAAKLGDTATSNREWTEAMEEAKSSTREDALLSLHRLALEAASGELADRALIEAIRIGRGPLPLYSDLKPLLESLSRQKRESELVQVTTAYLPFEPGNTVLLTQYAYLSCLTEATAPDEVIKAVEPLASQYPEAIPIRCVLATAHLMAGNPAAAAAVLDPLELNPETLAPPYRAVFEVTQVRTGKLSADDPRISKFPWDSLLPSERRQFTRLLKTP